MRDLADMPLNETESEEANPFEIRITCKNRTMWKLEAFHYNMNGQQTVSTSWHRTRAEALKEAQSFA